MKRWLVQLGQGPTLPAVLLSLAFTALAVELSPVAHGTEGKEVVFYETGALVPGEGESIAKQTVGAHETASVHHLVITQGVEAHYHRTHDETVIVLAGEGRMAIGNVTRPVRPGLVLLVPRGTVHSLEVTGDPVEAISMFSPPFDGKDRIFVD